jgi:hypothetical protein
MQAPNQELPSQHALDSLSLTECTAIAEILKLGVEADAAITQQEVATLAREFAMLPGIEPSVAHEMLSPESFFTDSPYSEQSANEEVVSYSERLKEFTSQLDTELSRMSTLRLLAVLFASDGIDETEVEFYRRVAEQFEVDFDTASQLLRAAWSDPANQT